ncbi:uncharacterized protein LOC116340825 [Contarinia nasturtii]|uniref:uncharacterized protein LOC116340825 n=1 Tax=Contarinia nasturtii TaxID=265458 RepID=UPI0012D3C807|nr:uncharacterized protein LOC116340825 [Contarinia nasturtii]
MKLFLILTFLCASIFNQFVLINCQGGNSGSYTSLLQQLNIKAGRSNLARKLQPFFTLERGGVAKILEGTELTIDSWVTFFTKNITFSYIHADEMCRKRVSSEVNDNLCERLCNVLNAYKEDVMNIGKVYHDIFLVYLFEPTADEIKGFNSALVEFKKKRFERESEINGELENMQTTYHQLVNEVNAKIDQSVTLNNQYNAQVTSFKNELKTLFLQTKKIDGRKLYESAQLDALNTALTALREKQLELATCLQNLLSAIQAYNDQRIKWAGFLMNTSLPPRPQNKLGVMGH